MRICKCTDMCIGMGTGMCLDMCLGMRADMCADMCIDEHRCGREGAHENHWCACMHVGIC